jgi:hypothetical protein
MNNPYYRLLKNRYIAPTSNAGAPSPSNENSGTVWVEVVVVGVVVVGVVVASTILGCAVGTTFGIVAIAVALGVVVAATVAFGVVVAATVAFAAGLVVPIAACIADSICACVIEPSNLADCAPETTIVGVVETPFASATPLPGLEVTSYVTNVTPYFAAAL